MLISKSIKVIISKSSKNLFKHLGKIGDEVNVPINELKNGSRYIVCAECDICKTQKYITYKMYNKNIKSGYFSCSKICSIQKRKNTCLLKYGVDNPIKSKIIKDKVKDTNMKKYGVENPGQSEKVKLKIKNTCIEKYGVENPFQSEKFKDKIKNTCIEKYGVENPGQLNNIKLKIKNTCIEKYGVENPFQLEKFKDKIKETNLLKYGVENPGQSEKVKLKIKETNLFRYCVENPFQSEKFKDKIKNTCIEKWGVPYYSQSEDFQHQLLKSISVKNYNGIAYQSSYELDFIKLCEINGIILERGPRIHYILNSVSHYYFPDFYVKSKNIIVEIKSTYWWDKEKEKNIVKREYAINNGYNYELIMDKNYEKFLINFS